MITVSLSEGADRSSAARMQNTSRVSRRSCSRASCISASICLYPTRTRQNSRCELQPAGVGLSFLRLSQLWVPDRIDRIPCVVWSQQGFRPKAIGIYAYMAYMGVPRIFSPLILSGSLGDALHNPKTLNQTFIIHLQKQHSTEKLVFGDFFFRTGLGP